MKLSNQAVNKCRQFLLPLEKFLRWESEHWFLTNGSPELSINWQKKKGGTKGLPVPVTLCQLIVITSQRSGLKAEELIFCSSSSSL